MGTNISAPQRANLMISLTATECQSNACSPADRCRQLGGPCPSLLLPLITDILSIINSMIKALSASNQVQFPCLDCDPQHAGDDYHIVTGTRWTWQWTFETRYHAQKTPTWELRLAILGMQAGSGSPPGSMALTFSTLAVLLNEKSVNGHGVLNFL